MSTSIGSAGKLDVITMVAQLVAADRAQPEARIARNERQVNAQISAIGTLRNAFSALGTATGALTSSDNLQARDRKSTRLNSSHRPLSRMPSSA